MKKSKKVLAMILAVLMAITAVPGLTYEAKADSKYTVIIDGKVFTPTNPVHNIEDRIFMPYREIGEAMGATVEWLPETREVLALRGSRFARFTIGESMVTSGTYSTTSAGQRVYNGKAQFIDVAPVIINDWTYLPIRYIAEHLGGTVAWNGQTSTATITTAKTDIPVITDPVRPEVEEPDNYGDFSNTSYFRIISSSAMKEKYDDANNWPFIFVLYDSSEDSSKRIVPNIQDAAQDIEYRIYGVDMNDRDNRDKDNEWLWDFFRERDFEDPTLYLVHSKSRVSEIKKPTNMKELKKEMEKFATVADTDYEYGDFDDTNYFKKKSDTYIRDEYEDRREFMMVLYDSTNADSKQTIPMIKAAAKDKDVVIYGLDIDRYPNYYNKIKFLEDYDSERKLPIMFLVYKDKDDIVSSRQPESVSKIKSLIDDFKKKSGSSSSEKYSTIKTQGNFTDFSIGDAKRWLYDSNNNSVIILYNSDLGETKEGALNAVSVFTEDDNYKYKENFFYGIDEANFRDSDTKRDHRWLYDYISNDSRDYPMLISIRDKSIRYKYRIKTKTDVKDFLYDYGSK